MRQPLPDFPWDALAPYAQKAREFAGGIIDLSQGTPVDSTPQIIQSALRESADSPRYPVTAGTKELQDAIKETSKKYGIPYSDMENIVLNEINKIFI